MARVGILKASDGRNFAHRGLIGFVARGLISGLTTLSHGRGHLYRAMLGATAYGVRHIFEYMQEAGGKARRRRHEGRSVDPDRLRRHGQGARAPRADHRGLLWRHTARRWGRGPSRTRTERRLSAPSSPTPRTTSEVYDRLYGVYRDLYPATREASHVLAAL